jgi:DNA-binding transcriptional regulator YiaG
MMPPMTNPITALRVRLGQSQAGFAESIGRTQSTVSRWESGDQAPDLEALRILQDKGMDVAEFLAWRRPAEAA